ncbi:MAG: YdcF family protein [bacterium]|nr:YdcF family protein [bacterium]
MLRRLIVCCALLLACDLIAAAAFNAMAENFPPRATAAPADGQVKRPVAEFDAVVVFCAGIGPHSGLDATTVERLHFAAELYRRGAAPVVVGIGGHWRENRLAKRRDGMTRISGAAGLPGGAIVQDRESYDTVTNIDEFFRLADAYGWRRVAFVTSPLHMLRVRYESASRSINASQPDSISSVPVAESLEIVSLPFTASGQASLFAAWREAHHEWIAWSMTLVLPETVFRKIMRWRRL